jgi:hypothetical protein
MPIPTPTTDESETEYMRRCMSDEYMLDEFDDNGQRFSVCSNTWDEFKYGSAPETLRNSRMEKD